MPDIHSYTFELSLDAEVTANSEKEASDKIVHMLVDAQYSGILLTGAVRPTNVREVKELREVNK